MNDMEMKREAEMRGKGCCLLMWLNDFRRHQCTAAFRKLIRSVSSYAFAMSSELPAVTEKVLLSAVHLHKFFSACFISFLLVSWLLWKYSSHLVALAVFFLVVFMVRGFLEPRYWKCCLRVSDTYVAFWQQLTVVAGGWLSDKCKGWQCGHCFLGLSGFVHSFQLCWFKTVISVVVIEHLFI